MPRLFQRHHPASLIQYQDALRAAHEQPQVFAGTPGTLRQRTQGGRQYWVRQYISADGRKTDDYIGPVESIDAARVQSMQYHIAQAQSLAEASGRLRLLGFQRIDRKPAAVLGALFNAGLFEAGLTLVGSHAYGILLNELGIQAATYQTRDVDVARSTPLAIALPAQRDFLALLNESGLGFVPVPGMPSSTPSSSFKQPVPGELLVDLLVPGKPDALGKVVAVKELHTHAQAIPYLDYLLGERLRTAALSPVGIVPVWVPSPERFALHKMLSSQSRRQDLGKAGKDREQAAVIIAALEAQFPGRTLAAAQSLPPTARALVRKAAAGVMTLLEAEHADAQEALERLAE